MSAESEKYPPILDGTFFTVKQVKDGKVTARCVNCVGNKELHGTLEATSNFLRHLKVSSMHRLSLKAGLAWPNRGLEMLSIEFSQTFVKGNFWHESDVRRFPNFKHTIKCQ